jgi:hypothetical protein
MPIALDAMCLLKGTSTKLVEGNLSDLGLKHFLPRVASCFDERKPMASYQSRCPIAEELAYSEWFLHYFPEVRIVGKGEKYALELDSAGLRRVNMWSDAGGCSNSE